MLRPAGSGQTSSGSWGVASSDFVSHVSFHRWSRREKSLITLLKQGVGSPLLRCLLGRAPCRAGRNPSLQRHTREPAKGPAPARASCRRAPRQRGTGSVISSPPSSETWRRMVRVESARATTTSTSYAPLGRRTVDSRRRGARPASNRQALPASGSSRSSLVHVTSTDVTVVASSTRSTRWRSRGSCGRSCAPARSAPPSRMKRANRDLGEARLGGGGGDGASSASSAGSSALSSSGRGSVEPGAAGGVLRARRGCRGSASRGRRGPVAAGSRRRASCRAPCGSSR